MDKQSEQRREYFNQLNRLKTNFEQLDKNMAVLREQAELSQRLAISHASMFIGSKGVFEDNK
ncbi:hypothetical protein IW140_003579 [Coemansia sp. RSA 1813]|nr:hypothetical protein IW140_003579 [Coemansia sp. RSA 1813]